jgi:hypothetical protein
MLYLAAADLGEELPEGMGRSRLLRGAGRDVSLLGEDGFDD